MGPEMTEPPGAAPAIPEPPWYRPDAQPRVPLTREAIVDAALAVLDAVGMDGLSMRRVAQELGTGAASLYWHVRNKDELFQLVFDRVTREIVLPEPDAARWQDQLKLLGYEMRKALSKHRDVARISFGRVPTGPQMALLTEWLFTLLQPVGIPDRAIAYIGDVAGLYVGAFCFEESLGVSSPTGEDLPPEQIVEMFRGYMQSLPAERFPRTLASLDLIFEFNPEDRFEFGLDLMISGLEKYAERAAKRATAPK
ncbi:MAG: TetR/AcrR family transcriptional regulator C-terminal domain-containing protein [Acidimicrobiales bacterium]|jgi:AcrR family transcriptional regulator